MQSYFIWNGVDSRSKGVISKGHAPLIRPEERVNHVQIPGRSGDLTETEGENIFNSYIQTVSFSVNGMDRVLEVFRWLRGDGYVTFSGEPDKKQQARVVGAVTLERVSRNLDVWRGQAQFYCQPFKQRIYDTAETLTASGAIKNAGDVNAYPVIIATPANNATSMTVTVNGDSFVMTDVDGARRIDCGAREVSNTGKTALYTIYSSGPFPVLKPGSNTIAGSGWDSLQIYKEERFL